MMTAPRIRAVMTAKTGTTSAYRVRRIGSGTPLRGEAARWAGVRQAPWAMCAARSGHDHLSAPRQDLGLALRAVPRRARKAGRLFARGDVRAQLIHLLLYV